MSVLKLQRGDRVRLSKLGREVLIDRYKRLKPSEATGVVTDQSPTLSHCVLIRIRGSKKPRSFDADYWVKVKGGSFTKIEKPRPLPLYHGSQRLLFIVDRVDLREIDRVLSWMKKARRWRLKTGGPR